MTTRRNVLIAGISILMLMVTGLASAETLTICGGDGEIFGDVLRDNATMLKLCKSLGFTQAAKPDEPDIIRVCLKLENSANESP